MKASVLRYAAIGMATMSLAGFAAASTVSVGTTGADSHNIVKLDNSSRARVHNENMVGALNLNAQGAQSGDVSAYKNTSVQGNVGSGDAKNSNDTTTNVSVNNSAGMGNMFGGSNANDNVSIGTTGADSTNKVTVDNSSSVKVSNENTVLVGNLNFQGATSGDVHATKNTTIGGLSSGNASNQNSTVTSVTVNN